MASVLIRGVARSSHYRSIALQKYYSAKYGKPNLKTKFHYFSPIVLIKCAFVVDILAQFNNRQMMAHQNHRRTNHQ